MCWLPSSWVAELFSLYFCASSIERSRAEAVSNWTRSILSLALRILFGPPKRCARFIVVIVFPHAAKYIRIGPPLCLGGLRKGAVAVKPDIHGRKPQNARGMYCSSKGLPVNAPYSSTRSDYWKSWHPVLHEVFAVVQT